MFLFLILFWWILKKIVDTSLKDDEEIFFDVQPMPPLLADEE